MRKRRTASAVLFVFFIGCSGSSLKIAKREIAAENYPRAIALLQTEVKTNPGNSEACYLLATCYQHAGQLDSAASAYRKTLALNTGNRSARDAFFALLLERAVTARQDDELRTALKYYKEAEGLAPDRAKVYFERGKAWLEKNYLVKASVQLQNAVELGLQKEKVQPLFDEINEKAAKSLALQAKGEKYLAKKRWAKAIQVLKEAVALNAENAGANYALHMATGHRLYIKGSISAVWDAITEFGYASNLRPENAEPYYYMAQAYEKKNKDDYELIVEAYQKAIDAEPGSSFAKRAERRIKQLAARKSKLEKFWGRKKSKKSNE